MRRRALGALAVALALSVGGVSTSGAAAAAATRPDTADRAAPAGHDAACIREGLAPIPVSLRAVLPREFGSGRPELLIRWSGKPLAAGCDARRAVAFQATVWFPHLRYSFNEGLIPWLEFWNGRRAVRNEEERYGGNASYEGLACPFRARAKLRYEVTAPGGAVLGRRIVSAPVKLPPCSQ